MESCSKCKATENQCHTWWSFDKCIALPVFLHKFSKDEQNLADFRENKLSICIKLISPLLCDFFLPQVLLLDTLTMVHVLLILHLLDPFLNPSGFNELKHLKPLLMISNIVIILVIFIVIVLSVN